MKRLALITGLILFAAIHTFGQTTQPTTQPLPSATKNHVKVTLLDTYVSEVDATTGGEWGSTGNSLCCLLLIQNKGTTPVRHLSWEGDLLNYKVDSKGTGGAATLKDGPMPLPMSTNWGIATNGLSKAAWEGIWRAGAWQASHEVGKDNVTELIWKKTMLKMFTWGDPGQFASKGVVGFQDFGFFDDTLKPNTGVLELVKFSLPIDDADLTLTLPASNVGADKEYVFTIKQSTIRFNQIPWGRPELLSKVVDDR